MECDYKNYTLYCKPDKIKNLLECNKNPVFTKFSKIQYLNSAVSFDTETTSFEIDGRKYATVYAWAIDIFDTTIFGRTWDEFLYVCNCIVKFYHLEYGKKHMIIYVHNLAYDFAFFHKWFTWAKVFAVKSKTPLYAVTDTGLEFRCSYLLSGLSLRAVAESLNMIDDSKRLEKLDYDYTKIRHSASYMDDDEIEYLIHDVKIVTRYISKCIEQENGIDNIPLTKTGYVRRMCRARCLLGKNGKEYRNFILDLRLTVKEYEFAKRAFSGGFTHSNPAKTNNVYENVASYDIASSYPAVMISKKYPMDSGRFIPTIKKSDFDNIIHNDSYFMIFTVRLENIRPKFGHEFCISESKCLRGTLKKAIVTNGRIYKADALEIVTTSIDMRIIEKCYDFVIPKIGIGDCYLYHTDYLPKPIIECILDLYGDKTQLKGIKEKVEQYQASKGMLNGIYGMSVTDIVRDIIEYNTDENKWKDITPAFKIDESEKIKILQKSDHAQGKFLYYMWGVAITAYARFALWTAIFELGSDYIYSDTDSVKFINHEKHTKFFENYNMKIQYEIMNCLVHYKLNPNAARPKDKKGNIKPMGIYEFEGIYTHFKTLGAKRYLYRDYAGFFHLTCAGVKPETAVEYLLKSSIMMTEKQYIEMVFDRFKIGMVIPAEYTGKQTHSYIDDEFTIDLVDADGIKHTVHELSCIHLSPCDFDTNKKSARAFMQFVTEFCAKKM